MNKSCILIGAPGSDAKGNYLNGVSIDMNRMRLYLLSNTGGAWREHEIEQIVNPTKEQLVNRLNKAKKSDFSLVLFSGHGGISKKDGRAYLEINTNGDDFPAEGLINHTNKELVIIDSCRSYFTPTTLSGDAMMKAINEEVNISLRYRQAYEKCIAGADKGSLILYACSVGETANDTSEGGIFTQSLINVGLSLKEDRQSNLYQPVNQTFNQAKSIVSQRFKTQNPTMEGSLRRNTWFPFALKL
ncbi:caspase family protein [Leptospira noguchii]|uniref:caspase family protein n=1 Tax=Leptospira noguchii TaxID=28182 RepID=UPI001FB6D3D1|nr:caspase family protein [Leptospira noguchii]UOG33087.1 caspase family protein [Leptospira noguchii]UOG43901.1 caspase family protein [Leptospira noguchii]